MKRFKLKLLILVCLNLTFKDVFSESVPQVIDNTDLQIRIQKAIDAQLRQEEEIAKKVKLKIEKIEKKEIKEAVKNDIYGEPKKISLAKTKKELFVYKLPTWPFCSLFYMQKNLFSVDFYFDYAKKTYWDNGWTKDLSALVFGKNKIHLKDILLVSDLLDKKILTPPPTMQFDPQKNNCSVGCDLNDQTRDESDLYNSSFLYLLADQKLDFDAKQEKQTFDINYARHFFKGDLSVGLQIPIVIRTNKLNFSSPLSENMRNNLEETVPNFFDFYDDMQDFFDDICEKKNTSFHKKSSSAGLGDISIFVNLETKYRAAEKIVAGINLLLPTSKQRNVYTLWDPELGNGGFTQISLFNGALFPINRFLNPHIFLKLSASFQASVYRRVPKAISYNGQDENAVPQDMIFAEDDAAGVLALYTDQPFTNQLDSKVLNLSDFSHKIGIRQGPEFFCRLGNIMEKIILENAFLDIFYDLRLKGKDYLGFRKDGDRWNGSILTEHTDQIEQNIGFDLSYQFDESLRSKIGFVYTFAGRNVPQNFQLNLGLNIEF